VQDPSDKLIDLEVNLGLPVCFKVEVVWNMQHRYFGLTGAGPERWQNDEMSQCGALGNASVDSKHS
jgi:hypothetical protein